jgi:hypothetical protein
VLLQCSAALRGATFVATLAMGGELLQGTQTSRSSSTHSARSAAAYGPLQRMHTRPPWGTIGPGNDARHPVHACACAVHVTAHTAAVTHGLIGGFWYSCSRGTKWFFDALRHSECSTPSCLPVRRCLWWCCWTGSLPKLPVQKIVR